MLNRPLAWGEPKIAGSAGRPGQGQVGLELGHREPLGTLRTLAGGHLVPPCRRFRVGGPDGSARRTWARGPPVGCCQQGPSRHPSQDGGPA
jgi:hypothetical protein